MAFIQNLANHLASRWGEIVTEGFNDPGECPVTGRHFLPCNAWKNTERQCYILDLSTGDRYINDSPSCKRQKCLALVGTAPLGQAVNLLLVLANRVGKLVTFAHFWHPDPDKEYSFLGRLVCLLKDLLLLALIPILYLGFFFAALYGLILPNDGGKLFATLERVSFGKGVLAPCFQPEPSSHLFGGNPQEIDHW